MLPFDSDFGIYNNVFNLGDLVCLEEEFFLRRGRPRHFGEVIKISGVYVTVRWQLGKEVESIEAQYLINVSNLVDRTHNMKGIKMKKTSADIAIKSTRIFSEGLQNYLDKFVKSRARVLEKVLVSYTPGIQYESAETVLQDESFYFLTFFGYGDIDISVQVKPFENLFTLMILGESEDFLSVDMLGAYLKDVLTPEDSTEESTDTPPEEV